MAPPAKRRWRTGALRLPRLPQDSAHDCAALAPDAPEFLCVNCAVVVTEGEMIFTAAAFECRVCSECLCDRCAREPTCAQPF